MYCKLCGKHLYETITFVNLFKWKYNMHEKCESSFHIDASPQVFPLADKIVYYDYLFERGYEEADIPFLFTKYMGYKWSNAMENKEWSILIFLDDMGDPDDLTYIIQLANQSIYILSTFNEIQIP